MSRLFTFFEILSHNLAFVCAPAASTIHHRPYPTLFCLHLRVYRPAGAIRRSARLLSATIHRALSPASRKRDTRSMLRLFRCAQYAYAMRYCPCGQYAHLCTAISLRSIRRASSAMRSIDCLHSIKSPTSSFYRPTVPTFHPLMAHAPKTSPHPRHFLKIVEKKKVDIFFFFYHELIYMKSCNNFIM